MAKTIIQPTYFLAHGNPFWLVEKNGAGPTFLKKLGKQILSSPSPPTSVLIVSAHWETHDGVKVTTNETHSLLYDYYGFPKNFYDIKYPAKGDPAMAKETIELLKRAGFKAQPEADRGLDHGAFTLLLYMFPQQQLPIVQLSLPVTSSPTEYYRLGEALRPLRSQGVLILGAGYLLHNLRIMIPKMSQNPKETDPILPWAQEFINATRNAVLEKQGNGGQRRRDAVVGLFGNEHFRMAHPTPEHFAPFVVAAGAGSSGGGGGGGDDTVELVHEYWFAGCESQDSYRFGSVPLGGGGGSDEL
ncbi:Extradiol ring-cleavage dioxygenase, class III enzyme, subunit B [Obelidium mucronatum]|nr:Extradiol ring-cleavage dioxygenase, class III enzyme, subunit B [Obelidium mucronatum]